MARFLPSHGGIRRIIQGPSPRDQLARGGINPFLVVNHRRGLPGTDDWRSNGWPAGQGGRGGDCGSGAGRDSSAFGGLSVANTGGDAGWLLLATAVELSGKVGRDVSA